MAATENPEPPGPEVIERRVPRAGDAALASSVPDDNSIFRQILEMLFSQKGWISAFSVPGGVLAILVWVVSKWGVAAILACQTLILQINEDSVAVATADRQVQVAQVKATEDVITAVGSMAESMKQLSTEVKIIAADLAEVKAGRQADAKQMNALSAKIKAESEARQNAITTPPIRRQ